MNFGLALMQMLPNVSPSQYELMMQQDGSVKITRWDRTDVPQPLESDVENYWNTTGALQYAQEQKTAELQAKCDAALVAGFTSSALGTAHTYPSHDKAQSNFNTEMNRFLTDPTYTSCMFYTEDAGWLSHTKDQLTQAFKDGHDYGNAQWDHLFGLLKNVALAKTPADVDAITW
jgi:hypothetical protein